jgi:hypothetical protein
MSVVSLAVVRLCMTMVVMRVVMVVMMSMIMGVVMMVRRSILTPVMTLDAESPPRDAVAFTTLETAAREGDRKGGKGILKYRFRNAKVTKAGNGHVAANSCKGIDMKDSHEGLMGRISSVA